MKFIFLDAVGFNGVFYTRSDRWILMEQEGKTFYAEQATRGPRVCEFLTTPRGRIFSLLAFYTHF